MGERGVACVYAFFLTFAFVFSRTACAKAKNWRKALGLLNEMEENGIMPNAITYSVAINACGNGGQWEKALALLDKVSQTRSDLTTWLV